MSRVSTDSGVFVIFTRVELVGDHLQAGLDAHQQLVQQLQLLVSVLLTDLARKIFLRDGKIFLRF